MQVTTHPSNPPANATEFETQQSGVFEIASWKQTSKPDVESTPNAAYKVLKFGDQYLVLWARRIPSSK